MTLQGFGPPQISTVTISSSTPTAISTSLPKVGIQIKAAIANTGVIYIGGGAVSSTNCYPLAAGESVFLPVDNVSLYFALAAVNNEKIHIIVL